MFHVEKARVWEDCHVTKKSSPCLGMLHQSSLKRTGSHALFVFTGKMRWINWSHSVIMSGHGKSSHVFNVSRQTPYPSHAAHVKHVSHVSQWKTGCKWWDHWETLHFNLMLMHQLVHQHQKGSGQASIKKKTSQNLWFGHHPWWIHGITYISLHEWLVIYGVHVGKYTLRPIYPEVAGLPSRLPVRSRSTCEEHGLRLGYRPELGWIYPSQNTVTPPKFNIDPEKGWKRKKFPFRNWDAR